MTNFTAGQTIKVNDKNFSISVVESHPHYILLNGTLQGDPAFLTGKRTIVASELNHVYNEHYTYDWNAK